MVQRKSLGNGEGMRKEYAQDEVDAEWNMFFMREDSRYKHETQCNKPIIEDGVRVFDEENIKWGNNIYVGHDCFIHGYKAGPGLEIGDNCWIGPGCYIHAAGGIKIGKNTGIGPHVKMLTSYHDMHQTGKPVIENELKFEGIEIGGDCDIGMGVMLLPGAKIGRGCIVEAGAIVREDLSGCEMRIIKMKDGRAEPHEVRRVI